MADTEVKTNGPVDGEKIPWDPDDPEVQRQLRRPADIDQDMKEMDRRKRVEMILNSKVFREELERIIEAQLKEGYNPASLIALQQISELILPHSHYSGSASLIKGSVIPIADIRGVEALAYAKGEKAVRCKLASLYRLVDLLGWSSSIFNHITVRLSQDQEHFLINPYGLLYHEITASSLVKVDIQGNIIDPGTTNLGINPAGYVLHSAIHSARPDIRCIIHVHVPACITVSSYKHGFLPLSQEALIVGDVSYHDYTGLLVDLDEREALTRDLGPTNKVLLLRNHGVVCCGETIEEAFLLIYHVVLACQTQVNMIPMGSENMIMVSDSVVKRFKDQMTSFERMREGKQEKPQDRPRKPKTQDVLFESYMRMLDNAGYRTGHMYRTNLVRTEPPRPKNDVEIPPASSAYTHIFDEDDLVKFSPLKKFLDSRKAQDKTRWLNSPNVYQKVEILETGTSDPKKITKWVAEGSPTHSTSFKIESPHQFTPAAGTAGAPIDPKEFKRKQKELKENRLQAKVTAGPQSHILDGATWDEVKKLQDASISGTGDQVVVVGAASKGIIQREFQHNAMVYKTPYAKNPFDSVTDEDLEEYKRTIERKQRGETDEEEEEQQPTLIMETSIASVKSVGDVETDATPLTDHQQSLPQSPTSPISDDEVFNSSPKEVLVNESYAHHVQNTSVDTAINGDDTEAKEGIRSAESGENISGASRSSKEGSPTKEVPGASPKKEKKKKKGIRTPSFLKKKKDKKKKEEAEEAK